MKKPTLQKIISMLGIVAVIGLVFYNTRDIFLGAPLSVVTVKDGTTVTESFLPISGVAKNSSSVSINGRIVAVAKNGSFSDGVVLSPGYNIIEIAEQDRFGKEKHKVFHLVAEPSSDVATNFNIHYQ
jgi:hypothetical protein